MGVPGTSLAQAAAYLEVVSLGSIGLFLLNAACAFLRAQGDSVGPLAIMAFSAAANVILDFILIVGFGLGVVGAAIATVSAQGVGAVFALWLARRRFASARGMFSSLRSAMSARRHSQALELFSAWASLWPCSRPSSTSPTSS